MREASRGAASSPMVAAVMLSGKYDNARGDDKTDGLRDSRPRLDSLIGRWPALKRIFRRIRGFSRHISQPARISSRPASVFLSVDCGALFPSAAGEAIILGRELGTRKELPSPRKRIDERRRSTRTLEFRRVCANRIIFVCGEKSGPVIDGIPRERSARAEFLNVAS